MTKLTYLIETQLKRLFILLCLALLHITSNVAYADIDDTINFGIGASYQHDSNLFRLPTGQQPLGSGAERSDNILEEYVDVRILKKYSLQAFNFYFAHSETKYANADFLNFNANNYKAAWLWSVTPEFSGNLSTERTVELVPFIDYQNTNKQNIKTIDNQRFDFDWSPHEIWHLLGGYSKLTVANSQTFLPETSFKLDEYEAGVKYSFPSQSYIALKYRFRNGAKNEINTFALIGKNFTEKEEELNGVWILSGKSRLNSNFGYINRIDDTFSIRNYSGYFGGVNYVWDVTSKVNLTLGLSRRLTSFQDINSSYNVYDSVFIKPEWVPTSKIVVKASAEISKRKYVGGSPLISATQREDDSKLYSLSVDWTPRRTIKIGVNLQHDARNSNLINRDYSSNSAGISGQLLF